MKKIASLLLLLAVATWAAAPDKSRYDLSAPTPAAGSEVNDPDKLQEGTLARSAVLPALHQSRPSFSHASAAGGAAAQNPSLLLSNAAQLYQSQLEATSASEIALLTGGYYTIGTRQGLTSSALDDDCGITFGHPYALTSYPLLAIDGRWDQADAFFPADALQPQKHGDTLLVRSVTRDSCRFLFTLFPVENGGKITITAQLTNLATTIKSLGLGLVFDPALGRWSDGALFSGSTALQRETLISKSSLPGSQQLWERGHSAKGLGITIAFSEPPDEQLAANWPYVLGHPEPGFATAADYLYDLTLRWSWLEQPILPGSSKTITVQIALAPPDFSSRSFARWDLPSALSADGDILFPQQFPSTVELANMSLSQPAGIQLELQLPEELTTTTLLPPMTVDAGGRAWPRFVLNCAEIYEDKTVPVTLTCKDNLGVADEITRYLHIPRVHFGETGLAVLIDSVITQNYPRVSLIFSAEVEATKSKLLNLGKGNLFFSENDARLYDFSLEKYTGGQTLLTDIVFVLDCSGSMGDNINAVRNNLGEFADSLRNRGYDYQIGVVTFSTTVDKVWGFTRDIESVKKNLASISLWGGEEDSPAGLWRASQFPFRDGSQRTIIWLTDENYSSVSFTKAQIVDTLLAKGITVHGIGPMDLQTEWFNPIVLPTGGNFYNIYGNFRDILLGISRLKVQDRYALSYTSVLPQTQSRSVKLEVHHAGLGGSATVTFAPAGAAGELHRLSCWPNPFNPVTRIQAGSIAGASGEITIYNLLGQRVRQFRITGLQERQQFDWDARDDHGQLVSSGAYFVELLLNDRKNLHRELSRVLYLK